MVRLTTRVVNVSVGAEFDVVLTGDSFPAGLSGYIMEYVLPPALTLIDVIFPAEFLITNHARPLISAADAVNAIPPGSLNVPMVTFRFMVNGIGPTMFGLNVIQLDDDGGNPIASDMNIGAIKTIPIGPLVARWIIEPVVETIGSDGFPDVRPLSSTLRDVGRPIVKLNEADGSLVEVAPTQRHSSCIGTAPWCLSLIWGVDLSEVDGQIDIKSLTQDLPNEKAAQQQLRRHFTIAERIPLDAKLSSIGRPLDTGRRKQFIFDDLGRAPGLDNSTFDAARHISGNRAPWK